VETFCERKWSEIGASADHAYQEQANGASALLASYLWKAHQMHSMSHCKKQLVQITGQSEIQIRNPVLLLTQAAWVLFIFIWPQACKVGIHITINIEETTWT
jgi:hypothetical protein